jgi:hypothetical protein
MPGDEADLCLDEFVQPTVDEFLPERSKGDVRRAKLACIVVASLVDYIHVARPSLRQGLDDVRKYRAHLASQCRAYALVRDICDATKHMRLSRSAEFKDIATMQSDFSVLTTEDGRAITTEDGTPIAVENWVEVQTDSGKERVDLLVVEALEFLTKLIGR